MNRESNAFSSARAAGASAGPLGLVSLAVLGSLGLATPAWAANECRVEYGYHTMSGLVRTDRTATVNLDLGESKTFNQDRMNYVKNMKNTQVKVGLQGALQNNFTLPGNGANPVAGFYLSPTTLKKLECMAESPNQLALAWKAANKSATQVAQALKDWFNLTGAQVAAQLQAVGYTAAQAMAAMQTVFNATATQAAQWAQVAGYAGQQVAAALKSVFNASATAAANALKTAYNASATVVAAWLQAAGYAGAQVAAALKSAFNATATAAAQALQAAFNAGGAAVAAWLHAANYGAQQIAAALKAVYNATATQAAQWLKAAVNGTAQQMAQWLFAAGYTLQEIAAALAALDYQPGDVVKALKALGNATAAQVIAVLKVLGTQYSSCAAVCPTVSWLQAAGYLAGEALGALRTHHQLSVQAAEGFARTVWNVSASGMAAVLTGAGYTAAQIASVLETGAANMMSLNYVVPGTVRACGRMPSGTIYGFANPLPLPPTGQPVTYTFGGQALATVSALQGLPSGVGVRRVESGACYVVFALTTPTNLRQGLQGQGRLMAGQAQGPSFGWRVGQQTSTTSTPAGHTGPIIVNQQPRIPPR